MKRTSCWKLITLFSSSVQWNRFLIVDPRKFDLLLNTSEIDFFSSSVHGSSFVDFSELISCRVPANCFLVKFSEWFSGRVQWIHLVLSTSKLFSCRTQRMGFLVEFSEVISCWINYFLVESRCSWIPAKLVSNSARLISCWITANCRVQQKSISCWITIEIHSLLHQQSWFVVEFRQITSCRVTAKPIYCGV